MGSFADSADSADSTVQPRCHVVVPCAGTGSRMGQELPKQYVRLHGQPLVLHTLAALRAVAALQRVVVVLAPHDGHAVDWPSGCETLHQGGATRADSVRAGLAHLLGTGALATDWVLVHDAARCLVTPALIERLMDACAHDEVGGLLALPLADTLKRSNAEQRAVDTPSRDHLWLAQTPQMFRLGLLHQALTQAQGAVTDEAAAVQALGLRPKLVAGDPTNIKITLPADLTLARAWLSKHEETP